MVPRWLTRVLIGTLAVPALFAGLVLWSFGDRDAATERIPAAVVNLDEPVTQGKGKNAQTVYAGRLLAAELTSPAQEEDRSLGWELAGADDALTGLQEGRYFAVVTIPEDFSRTLAGIAGRDPSAAEITVRSNDAASPVVAQVSDQIGTIASARLGRFITARYLEGVFTQTATVGKQLGKAAGAAGQLADGAGQLGAGVEQAGQGASELADGLGELDAGAAQLAGGATELSSGAQELAGGLRQLDTGAGELAAGSRELARRTRTLPGQAQQLADGAGQLAEGVVVYADLVADWAQACRTRPLLALQAPRLCTIARAAAGAGGAQAAELASGAEQLTDGTQELAAAAPELRAGIQQLAGGARQLAGATGEAATGATQLAGGARQLADGTAELATGASVAGDGARALATGAGQLNDGTGQLRDGAQQLATGLTEGAEQVPSQDPSEAGDMAEVVSQPVRSTNQRVGDPVDLQTSLTPAAVALALWIGAFVTFLVRPALPQALAERAGPAYRVVLGGLRPAWLLGLGQALLVVVATVWLAGSPAGLSGWLGLVAALALGGAVFAAVAQAFVAVSGPRRGWIALIVFTALQVVTLGGLVPIQTAPAPLAALDGLLPVSALARVVTPVLVPDAPASAAGAVVVLLVWAGAAGAVSVLAARRRQQVRVADLRRDLEPART